MILITLTFTECVAKLFCMTSKSAKVLGPLPEKLSDYLSDFAADLLVAIFPYTFYDDCIKELNHFRAHSNIT